MRFPLFISAALLAVPAYAQTDANMVAAGEHGAFSRVVIEKGADKVAVETKGRRVLLRNFDDHATYNFSAVNNLHKAHRVDAARIVDTPTGKAIEFSMACDCDVETAHLSNGKFVIDVRDKPGATPTPRKPNKPKPAAPVRKATIKSSDVMSIEQAHNRVVALLKQAAEEGLIEVKGGVETSAEEKAPPRLVSQDDLQTDDHKKNHDAATPSTHEGVDEHISTKTAELTPSEPATQSAGYKCFSDDALAIEGESYEESPMEAIATLQTALADATPADAPNAARQLASGFLSIGFGEEALGVLADQGLSQSLIADMASVVAERPLSPKSKLFGNDTCRGAHALWQAAIAAPKSAANAYERSDGAIKTLPKHLRGLMATRVAMKMIDANAWEHARTLHDIAAEASDAANPELDYVLARLEEAEGESENSNDALLEIASENSQAADDALLALAKSYVRNNEKPHSGFTEDIGALAKTTMSSEAVMAEAIAWANLGNIEAAMMLLKGVNEKSPAEREAAQLSAHSTLSSALANEEEVVALSAIEAFLQHKDWVVGEDRADPLPAIAAASAYRLGAPNLALAILDDTSPAEFDETRAILKARAAIGANAPEKAIKIAAPHMSDPAFAEVIVSANMARRQYHDALAAATTLTDANQKAEAASRAAWLARAWKSAADNFRNVDPRRLDEDAALQYALAAFMSKEKIFPPSANTVLSSDNETLAKGVESLFTPAPEGTVLQRGRQHVSRANDEILMVEEILNDG